jgi:hypothetical protein
MAPSQQTSQWKLTGFFESSSVAVVSPPADAAVSWASWHSKQELIPVVQPELSATE